MSPELIAILAVGVALIALIVNGRLSARQDFGELRREIGGLREAIAGRRDAA